MSSDFSSFVEHFNTRAIISQMDQLGNGRQSHTKTSAAEQRVLTLLKFGIIYDASIISVSRLK